MSHTIPKRKKKISTTSAQINVTINNRLGIPIEVNKELIADLKLRYPSHNWTLHQGDGREFYYHPTKKVHKRVNV